MARHPFSGISLLVLILLLAELRAATTLISYSGPFFSAGVVAIDSSSLRITSGTLSNGGSNGQDLAFDESGRLFGVQNGTIYEYDPHTLAVLNSRATGGELNGLAARNGLLYSYSGPFFSASLVLIDATSFRIRRGTLSNGGSNGQDLAFDESGRLFGVQDGTIYEYDPRSLAVLNSRSTGGALNGLAARNGLLYSYSGPFFSAGVVSINLTSLQLTRGTLSSGGSNGQDLAFDQSGRLFGVQDGTIYEYDPRTLAVLNSRATGGELNGLAIVPEPSASIFMALALTLQACRRKRPQIGMRISSPRGISPIGRS